MDVPWWDEYVRLTKRKAGQRAILVLIIFLMVLLGGFAITFYAVLLSGAEGLEISMTIFFAIVPFLIVPLGFLCRKELRQYHEVRDYLAKYYLPMGDRLREDTVAVRERNRKTIERPVMAGVFFLLLVSVLYLIPVVVFGTIVLIFA